MQRTQKLLTAGGVLGALAASSCCILPLALFGLGVSGAWIGHLTRLAPYQPDFIAGTAGCLGFGYWLRYRSRRTACAEGEACARPLPNRSVTIGLILAICADIVRPGLRWLTASGISPWALARNLERTRDQAGLARLHERLESRCLPTSPTTKTT